MKYPGQISKGERKIVSSGNRVIDQPKEMVLKCQDTKGFNHKKLDVIRYATSFGFQIANKITIRIQKLDQFYMLIVQNLLNDNNLLPKMNK